MISWPFSGGFSQFSGPQPDEPISGAIMRQLPPVLGPTSELLSMAGFILVVQHCGRLADRLFWYINIGITGTFINIGTLW